jgi:hypothetical protein
MDFFGKVLYGFLKLPSPKKPKNAINHKNRGKTQWIFCYIVYMFFVFFSPTRAFGKCIFSGVFELPLSRKAQK